MKKTSYHKVLERVRYKIDGKAWEAVLNHDDPARFKQLEAIYSDPNIQRRVELLNALCVLESKVKKDLFDTWLAMLLSGQARIKAPLWAVKNFEEIGNARLLNKKEYSLDKAFGFEGFEGETPEALARVRYVRLNELFREIWDLTLLHYPVRSACRMVAQRYQRDMAEQDRKVVGRWRLGKSKKSGTAEYLRQHYRAWETSNDQMNKRYEEHRRNWLTDHKDEYLKRYPLTSLPKFPTVDKQAQSEAKARFEYFWKKFRALKRNGTKINKRQAQERFLKKSPVDQAALLTAYRDLRPVS